MGLCQSAEEKLARSVSHEIDDELNWARRAAKAPIKLLLLGPGESGKSTVVRQIRILHANGFSEFEINERRFVVYSNTVRSMFEILTAMRRDGFHFEKTGLEDENAKYFFEQIDRITALDYRPTHQDILLTRMQTTGIVTISFSLRNLDFSVIDVGGQRTQRRKWIHFFEDTDAIIFVAAINEYDQKLREDGKMNRLLESLALFEYISNCPFLLSSSVVLFLNKKDLFRQKIEKIPLQQLFPSYQDGADYKMAVAFVRKEFHKMYRRDQQTLYSHVTCATDTRQVEKVFNAVLDTIVQANMRECGI